VLSICPAGKEGKQMGVPMESSAFVGTIQQALGEVQDSLLAAATAFRDANIVDVTSYDELKAVVAEGEQTELLGLEHKRVCSMCASDV
jgi:hypothetical protein